MEFALGGSKFVNVHDGLGCLFWRCISALIEL